MTAFVEIPRRVVVAREFSVLCTGTKRYWHEAAEAEMTEVIHAVLAEYALTERGALYLSLAKCRRIWPHYTWAAALPETLAPRK